MGMRMFCKAINITKSAIAEKFHRLLQAYNETQGVESPFKFQLRLDLEIEKALQL